MAVDAWDARMFFLCSAPHIDSEILSVLFGLPETEEEKWRQALTLVDRSINRFAQSGLEWQLHALWGSPGTTNFPSSIFSIAVPTGSDKPLWLYFESQENYYPGMCSCYFKYVFFGLFFFFPRLVWLRLR